MFVLDKNIENSFFFTVDYGENVTLVFYFENYQSKQIITIPILVADLTKDNERYQKAEIPLQHNLKFSADYYEYKIFGASVEPKDLPYTDETLTVIDTQFMELLEIGKLYVKPATTTDVTYINTDTNVVYEQ